MGTMRRGGARGRFAVEARIVAVAAGVVAALAGCTAEPSTGVSFPSPPASPSTSLSDAPEVWAIVVGPLEHGRLLDGVVTGETVAVAYSEDAQTVVARSDGGAWLEWRGVPPNTTGADPGNGAVLQRLAASEGDIVFAVTFEGGDPRDALYAWRAGEDAPTEILGGEQWSPAYAVADGVVYTTVLQGGEQCVVGVRLDDGEIETITCASPGEWLGDPAVDTEALVAARFRDGEGCASTAIRYHVENGDVQEVAIEPCAFVATGTLDFVAWTAVPSDPDAPGDPSGAPLMVDAGSGPVRIGDAIANFPFACDGSVLWTDGDRRELRAWSSGDGASVAFAPIGPGWISTAACADRRVSLIFEGEDSDVLLASPLPPWTPPALGE